VLGVEVRRRAEVHAELLGAATDEDAAVEDERQAPPARVAAERAAQLKAVHPRHLDVGDDGVHRLAGEQLERGRAVGRGGHLVAGLAEQRREQTAARQGIVDDQDVHDD
jgi:hypothetical protein